MPQPAPIITLYGLPVVTVPLLSTFVDPGASASKPGSARVVPIFKTIASPAAGSASRIDTSAVTPPSSPYLFTYGLRV